MPILLKIKFKLLLFIIDGVPPPKYKLINSFFLRKSFVIDISLIIELINNDKSF